MNQELTEKQQIAQLKKQVAELSKFQHERKGTSKKETLDQISTPAHISEFIKDLINQERTKETGINERNDDLVIDIACGAGSLLIPWRDSGALLIGADLDEEALVICKENIPQVILFKHNSLECDTPCQIKEHIFYEGTDYERIKEYKGQRLYVMNPPFSKNNAIKFLEKGLELMGKEQEIKNE